MIFQVVKICFTVGLQDGHDVIIKSQLSVASFIGQYRPEGDVQDLACIKLVQQACPIFDFVRFGCSIDLRRSVVAQLVCLEMLQGECIDFLQQGIYP